MGCECGNLDDQTTPEAAAAAEAELEPLINEDEAACPEMDAGLLGSAPEEQNKQLEAEARAVFASLDSNSDGMLDLCEMFTALSESGMVDSEVEQFFASLDTDNDNLLSADEFVAGFQQYRQRARPPEQRAMLLSELVAFRDKHVTWIETASYNDYTKKTQMPTMYEVAPTLIEVATRPRQCSFSELGPPHAVDYFVSHVTTLPPMLMLLRLSL